MEMIKAEQLDELKQAIKDAQNDDTPYIGIADDELHVIGDPNKTEINPTDYVVRFAFPNTDEFRAKAKARGDLIGQTTSDGRMFLCERTYKGIYLTPRRIAGVQTAMMLIEEFLFDISENGKIRELSEDEIKAIMTGLYNEVSDAVYEVVGAVLRIPYDELEFVLPMNAVQVATKIYMDNPSAVNQTDLFFG